jgi:hypothetical protein
MLIEESLQAVANNFRTVVAQSVTKPIELADEVVGCTNTEELISRHLC